MKLLYIDSHDFIHVFFTYWARWWFQGFCIFIPDTFRMYILRVDITGWFPKHPNTLWGSVFEPLNVSWEDLRGFQTPTHQIFGGFGCLGRLGVLILAADLLSTKWVVEWRKILPQQWHLWRLPISDHHCREEDVGSYLSNEKNPGCLGYRGDYTTQLYRDFNKPL